MELTDGTPRATVATTRAGRVVPHPGLSDWLSTWQLLVTLSREVLSILGPAQSGG